MSELEAMEVLDTLRSLRQTYSDVRMVFTGSVGLHHIVSSLRKAGYNNEPTNDMYAADVPPLAENRAIYLANCLLKGENILTPNLLETATALAQGVDCIPFYIHHLVLKLKMQRNMVDATKISEIIDECFIDPLNPWKMEHYRERIDNYYKDDQRSYALNILDILAVVNQPLLFDELLTRLKIEPQTQDKETARSVLRLLERDYYIIRQTDRKYRFRYPLIQRYWNILRG